MLVSNKVLFSCSEVKNQITCVRSLLVRYFELKQTTKSDQIEMFLNFLFFLLRGEEPNHLRYLQGPGWARR